MTRADIENALHGIWAALDKNPHDTTIPFWYAQILQYCKEKKASLEDVMVGIQKYVVVVKYPVLSDLLDLIKPTLDVSIDMRMIDDYIRSGQPESFRSLPAQIQSAVKACGYLREYRFASNEYEKTAWIKKYKAARENVQTQMQLGKQCTQLIK